MDCRTARFLLDFHRPQATELPADEVAELERHLASCPDCDAVGRADSRLDDLLGPAMSDVPVPKGLKERLLGRLKEERGAALRRRLAWGLRGAAVAATLLVAVGLGWHFYVTPPPKLDIRLLAENDTNQHQGVSAQGVETWFKDKHQVSMFAPAEFNYEYLIDYHLTEVQGQRVPKLAFGSPTTRANVYVVRRDQFDLEDLAKQDPHQFDTLGRRMEVWPPKPERQNTAYIILFDGGDSLEPLLGEIQGH